MSTVYSWISERAIRLSCDNLCRCFNHTICGFQPKFQFLSHLLTLMGGMDWREMTVIEFGVDVVKSVEARNKKTKKPLYYQFRKIILFLKPYFKKNKIQFFLFIHLYFWYNSSYSLYGQLWEKLFLYICKHWIRVIISFLQHLHYWSWGSHCFTLFMCIWHNSMWQ